MTDDTIPDDARDAVALLRTYLDDDDQAAGIIYANCDVDGVLGIMTAIAGEELIRTKGKDGMRRWLDRIRQRTEERCAVCPDCPGGVCDMGCYQEHGCTLADH